MWPRIEYTNYAALNASLYAVIVINSPLTWFFQL